MMTTAGSLCVNLKNWDFSKGKISLDKEEADAIRKGLEKETPNVLTREEHAICGTVLFKYYCPKCGKKVWEKVKSDSTTIDFDYCQYCGNRVIRPKEEAYGNIQEKTYQNDQ